MEKLSKFESDILQHHGIPGMRRTFTTKPNFDTTKYHRNSATSTWVITGKGTAYVHESNGTAVVELARKDKPSMWTKVDLVEHSDSPDSNENWLMHHGIKGQKWGVRRFQNKDGSLTKAGEKRYLDANGEYQTKTTSTRNPKSSPKGNSSKKVKMLGDKNIKSDEQLRNSLKDGALVNTNFFSRHKKAIAVGVGAAALGAIAYTNRDKVGLFLDSKKGLSSDQLKLHDEAKSMGFDNNRDRFVKAWLTADSERFSRVSYDSLNNNDAVTLNANATMYRVTKKNFTSLRNDAEYVSINEEDRQRYRGFMPMLWNVNSPFGAGRNIYEMKMTASENIKAPGKKESFEMMEAAVRKLNPNASQWEIRYDVEQNFNRYQAQLVQRDTKLTGENKLRKLYFEEAQSRGYNAVIDHNDAGRLADKPLILINGAKSAKVHSTSKVSREESRNSMNSAKPCKQYSSVTNSAYKRVASKDRTCDAWNRRAQNAYAGPHQLKNPDNYINAVKIAGAAYYAKKIHDERKAEREAQRKREEKQKQNSVEHRFPYDDFIAHHGIKGQKWGVRRFQNKDGSYTNAGKTRKSKMANMTPEERKAYRDKAIKIGKTALRVAATAAIAYGATRYATSKMKQSAGRNAVEKYMSSKSFNKQFDQLHEFRQKAKNAKNPKDAIKWERLAKKTESEINNVAKKVYSSGEKKYKEYAKQALIKSTKDAAKKSRILNDKIAKSSGKALKTMGKIGAAAAIISQIEESRRRIAKSSGKGKAVTIAKETQNITRKVNNFTKGQSSGNNSGNNNNNSKNKNSNSSNVSTYEDGSRSSRQLTKEEKRIVKERRKAGESPREILNDMGLLAHSSDKFYDDVLIHHGVKGQHWGRRRFQNADGSLTPEGERRYEKVQELKQEKRSFRDAKREMKRAKSVYNTAKKHGSEMDIGNAKASYQKAKSAVKDAKKNLNETDIRRDRRKKALLIGAAALGVAAAGTTLYVNREHKKIAQREGRKAYDAFRNSDTYKQVKSRAKERAQQKITESRDLADSYGKLHAQSRKNLRTLGVGDKFFYDKKKEHEKKIGEYSSRQRKVNQMLENKANRIQRQVERQYNDKRFVDKAKDVYTDKRIKRKK